MLNRSKFPYATMGPDQLLPQARDSLNMLCIACNDLTKSVYEILNGKHNFNTYPWEPPGCKAIIHEHLQTHTSWGQKELIHITQDQLNATINITTSISWTPRNIW